MKRYIKSAIMPISDEPYDIRKEVVFDLTTDPEVLNELAMTTEDAELLQQIVRHPNTSIDTVEQIVRKAPWCIYSYYAAQRPDISPAFIDFMIDECWTDSSTMNALVANQPLTDDQLRKIADIALHDPDGYYGTCLALASLETTPPDILAKLSHHFDMGVVNAVYENPNTPEEVITRLNEWWGR